VVDALVFSRDRPLQLEACLRSLYLNAPQVAKATVIYKATSDRYQEGYTGPHRCLRPCRGRRLRR